MEDLLKFLLNIRRFPSVEIWVDSNGNYNALCSPSFERVLGSSYNLEGAIMDLVMRLEGYFTEEEKKELETMGIKWQRDKLYQVVIPGYGSFINCKVVSESENSFTVRFDKYE